MSFIAPSVISNGRSPTEPVDGQTIISVVLFCNINTIYFLKDVAAG